jgi:hypothetical protein
LSLSWQQQLGSFNLSAGTAVSNAATSIATFYNLSTATVNLDRGDFACRAAHPGLLYYRRILRCPNRRSGEAAMRACLFFILLALSAVSAAPAQTQEPTPGEKEKKARAALEKLGAQFHNHCRIGSGKLGVQALLTSRECTDADLKWLLDVPAIVYLEIRSDKITDDGVKLLTSLKELGALLLNCPAVTDNGLQHLTNLKELRVLQLNCPAITDTGLRDLERVGDLESFGVVHRNLSDAAIARFKESHPKVSTHFQEFSELLHGKVNRLTVGPKDDPITRLTKMRFNAALEVFERSWYGIQAGRAQFTSIHFTKLPDLVDAALDLGDVPEKAIVLKGALKALRQITLISESMLDAGRWGTNKHAEVLFEVRDLELRILRATKGKGGAR